VDSSELAKHGVQCWDFVNTVMNGLLPWKQIIPWWSFMFSAWQGGNKHLWIFHKHLRTAWFNIAGDGRLHTVVTTWTTTDLSRQTLHAYNRISWVSASFWTQLWSNCWYTSSSVAGRYIFENDHV
jgi:hypothetical protein